MDDAESLGGLQLDTHTPPVQVKRSLDTAYVLLPQDTKLKVGDTPRIAETLGYAGSIVELSAEDGRVVLRRSMKSGAMPRTRNHTGERDLAHLQRFAPEVLPVQFDQVERVEEYGGVMVPVANPVEGCDSILPA